MTRKELIENELSVLGEQIRTRKVKLEELTEDIKKLQAETDFDERIMKIRKEELSKLK